MTDLMRRKRSLHCLLTLQLYDDVWWFPIHHSFTFHLLLSPALLLLGCSLPVALFFCDILALRKCRCQTQVSPLLLLERNILRRIWYKLCWIIGVKKVIYFWFSKITHCTYYSFLLKCWQRLHSAFHYIPLCSSINFVKVSRGWKLAFPLSFLRI